MRASLREEKTLGTRAEEVVEFLRAVEKNECEDLSAITLSTIEAARLDKLLGDILYLENRQLQMPFQSRDHIVLAEKLHRKWIARFRGEYFNIDQTRLTNLSKNGRLKDVEFNNATTDDSQLWVSKKVEALSELEGNQQFEPGQ